MPTRYGLPKASRLKSRKQIDALFAGGKSVAQFPVRVSYRFAPAADESNFQIGVTASKRHFKKAVDRNRIKRLLREAYRLQKEELLTTLAATRKSGIAFFIYTDKVIAPYGVVRAAMEGCLKKLTTLAANEMGQ